MTWTKTEDGSIVDDSGKVIFFSTQRFIDDICIGNCCFICGADPTTKPFNDEHVFPEWLLRQYKLFDKRITLPNGQEVRYDRHTIPCCVECNSLMGTVIEKPMSAVLDGTADSVQRYVASGGGLSLFVWMGLIYLKLHLKNKSNRKELDTRSKAGMIADDYEWDLLHHIHTVVRCFYIDTTVDHEVMGSLLAWPVREEQSFEQFDFSDQHFAQSMMLRLGRTAIFVVFNDSCGALNFFQVNKLDSITGPISELQVREIMVEFSMLNLHLKQRPTYRSLLDMNKKEHRIVADLPERPELENWSWDVRGRLMWNAFEHAWERMPFAGSTKEEVKKNVLTGRATVLWDDKGNFNLGSAKPWDVPPN